MSDTELRPEPLRVPVVDVASRQSLVGPTPPPPAALPGNGGAVVQRAVRIVSDRPPAAGASESNAPPASVSATFSRSSREPIASTPTVRTASVPPPPPVEAEVAEEPGLERSIREAYAAGALNEALDHGVSDPHEASDGEAQVPLREAYAPALQPRYEPAANDADAPLPQAARVPDMGDGYASMEVEPLDTLELEDELARVDPAADEEELDASSIEVSVPPPAPAAALKRSIPSNDVEITVSYEDEDELDEDQRPSGEFEELDVEAAALRNAAHESARTPPPPPPYGRLSSLAEPPDLQTLTRTARVAEARPSKPRAHPWWEIFFDDDYLRTVRPPTHQQIARQCDFIVKRLGIKPGATVLDVACGLGLQAVELASRGYLSVGLDLSLAMLSRASEEAQARGTKINFLHADMRDMNFEGNFDAVMCIGTSLGYFDDDTNKKVIERLFRALKPNGVLLLDVVNRDHVIRTQPNLIWFEGDGCVCMEESEFNFFTSRLHVKRTVILENGKQRENEYSLRLYSLHELGQLLHQFGFRVIEVSGREALPGVFFGQESPNMMVVAERRSKADSTGKYPALVD